MSSVPKSRRAPRSHHFAGLSRSLFGLAVLLSPLAHAADYPGKALFDYAMPFVVFLGLAAICLSIVAALFKPEIAKTALYAAMLMVVLFTILKTAPSLVSAVQQ